MKFIKQLLIFIFFLLSFQKLNAEIPYFVDFKYILNQSDAGKKAQDYLKSKLNNGIKKLKDQERNYKKKKKNYSTKNLFHLKNTKKGYRT